MTALIFGYTVSVNVYTVHPLVRKFGIGSVPLIPGWNMVLHLGPYDVVLCGCKANTRGL